MKNLGYVFRNIRIDKNYSLKEVAEGILSVSFLSKFERGDQINKVVNFKGKVVLSHRNRKFSVPSKLKMTLLKPTSDSEP